MTEHLMTLHEAAKILGLGQFGHRKLRRVLLSAERSAGRRIGVRTGTKIVRWRVTIAQLRRYAPGMFSEATEQDELRRTIAGHLRDIDRKAEDVAREVVAEELSAVRSEITDGDRQVLVTVAEVAAGVQKLARRVAVLEVGFAAKNGE